MNHDRLRELRAQFRRLPEGDIDRVLQDKIKSLLAEVWDTLEGSSESSMAAHKVERAESLRVEDGCILFAIERHGGTVKGSSRACVQTWKINLEQEIATIVDAKRRQVHPTDKPLDVEEIATELAEIIGREQPDDRYSVKDAILRIHVGKFIKAGNPQTLASRRSRFRKPIRSKLEARGWIETTPHKYVRQG